MRPACSATAAAHTGSATPNALTAMPVPMSIYRLPASSNTIDPCPETSTGSYRSYVLAMYVLSSVRMSISSSSYAGNATRMSSMYAAVPQAMLKSVLRHFRCSNAVTVTPSSAGRP